MPKKLACTDLAWWDSTEKKIKLKCEETKDIRARRFRAKEVAETYSHRISLLGITFLDSIEVQLLPDRVCCSCQDIHNRNVPCKHIFAAAYLLGDSEAIAEDIKAGMPDNRSAVSNSSETKVVETANANKKRSWRSGKRPQDIRIGKYFMLSDFLYSEKAVTVGIPNLPPPEGLEIEALRGLAQHILDPVVDEFGPVSITYGYTSPELHAKLYGVNDRLGLHDCVPVKAKGAVLAAAADILVHSKCDIEKEEPRTVLFWIRDNCEFDRLILYPGSAIICTAWADQPRYDCKEWIFPDTFGKALYINARRPNN